MSAEAQPRVSRVALRVHATFDGQGSVSDGERLLGEVTYAIKDVDEVYEPIPAAGAPPTGAPPTGTPSRELVAPRSFYGTLKSRQAAVLGEYVGARLVLRLADGRRLDVTITKVLWDDSLLIRGLGELR